MVVLTFKSSTQEADKSMSSRLAWTTKSVPEKPEKPLAPSPPQRKRKKVLWFCGVSAQMPQEVVVVIVHQTCGGGCVLTLKRVGNGGTEAQNPPSTGSALDLASRTFHLAFTHRPEMMQSAAASPVFLLSSSFANLNQRSGLGSLSPPFSTQDFMITQATFLRLPNASGKCPERMLQLCLESW